MIRHVLENIAGIAPYPVVALVLFLAVFLGALLWALGLSREYVRKMKTLPLEHEAVSGGARHE